MTTARVGRTASSANGRPGMAEHRLVAARARTQPRSAVRAPVRGRR